VHVRHEFFDVVLYDSRQLSSLLQSGDVASGKRWSEKNGVDDRDESMTEFELRGLSMSAEDMSALACIEF
jgi:hypothetical protein